MVLRLGLGLVAALLIGLPLAGLAPAVPIAQAADTGQVTLTSVTQTDADVHLVGSVSNSGQPLYQAGIAVWVDTTPRTTAAGLATALASDRLGASGQALTQSATTYLSLSSGASTFAADASGDFNFTATWADLGLSADGVYLVGVELRGATSRYGTVATVARSRALVTLATTRATTAVTLVALTSAPSWLYGDVFADDHLAGELTGRLSALVSLADQAPTNWAIDPSLEQAVRTMANGYQVLVNGQLVDGTGQDAAKAWLTRLDQLDRNRGYYLPWGNPDFAAAQAAGDTTLFDALAGVVNFDPLPTLIRADNGLGDPAWLDYVSTVKPDVVLAGANQSGRLAHGQLIATLPVAFPGGPDGDASPDQVHQRRLAEDFVNGTTVRWITTEAEAALAAQPEPAWCQPIDLGSINLTVPFDPANLLGSAVGPLTAATAANVQPLLSASATLGALLKDPDTIDANTRMQQVNTWSQDWPDDAAATGYAQAVTGWLADQLGRVALHVSGPVTLTSRTTAFPVDITNGLDRPIYVEVSATSSIDTVMTFATTDAIMIGPGDTLPASLSPRVLRDGTVTATVTLSTPDGRAFGAVQSIEVTANQSAWLGWTVIIVAAALFVAGTLLRVRTARRKNRSADPATTDDNTPANPTATGDNTAPNLDNGPTEPTDGVVPPESALDPAGGGQDNSPPTPDNTNEHTRPTFDTMLATPDTTVFLVPPPVDPPSLEPPPEPTAEPVAALTLAADTSAATAGRRSMLNSTMLMASGTLVSRIFGAVKMLLLAYLIGAASRQSEIYSLATTIPTSTYMLIAGGILNAVLVPQIVRAIKNDPDGGDAYTNRITTAFLLILGLATVAMILGARGIASLFSDARWQTPEMAPQFDSIVLLTALVLPQVFFMGLYTILGQILNARGSFGPMMWAPVANNIIQIGLLGVYAGLWGFHTDWSQPFTTNQALLLGLGSVVGVACQAFILVPVMHRVGFHYRPRFDLRHAGLGHTFRLAGWTLGEVIVSQIGVVFLSRLGSIGTVGGSGAGNAAYNNAYLIWMVPHSLLTVSLGTALFPSLSRRAADRNWSVFRSEFISGARILMAGMVPISFVLVGLGIPIATLAYRGNIGGTYIGWTLMALGVGLVPFTLQYITQNCLYASEDTRSPFLAYSASVAVTCAVAATLILGLQVLPAWVAPSIGVARVMSYFVAAIVTSLLLTRRVPAMRRSGLVRHILLLAVAAAPGTALAWLICWEQKRLSDTFLADLIGLVAAVGVAVGVYLGIARLLHLQELDELVALVRRKVGRGKARGHT